ncbi:MAG: MotA/TolQ/ExbB proton channel family protein [Treponema sp.]|jgi:chemotaxis protein MotA|nr:MotA/TolQ/ExbB proton channel family protein [Treponema sp.]
MNISTLIGLVGTFAMCLLGIISGGVSVVMYADLPSFFITIVGSYLGVLTFSSIGDAVGMWRTFGLAFKTPSSNEKTVITKLLAFSEKARREGLLALEEELEDLDDEFLKKGMRLVVDGTDGSVIRTLLELDLGQIESRHDTKIGIINMWGTLAPGLGMLGTVIGLIAMLNNIEDKSALGPNMAVALITTLYGAMIANLICIPISGKLKTISGDESLIKEMEIEGILSIQAGENTRVLATKLLTYLDPISRASVEKEMARE